MTQPPVTPWTPSEPTTEPLAELRALPPRVRRRRRRWPWVLVALAALLVIVLVLLGLYGLRLARTFDDHRQTVDAGQLDAVDAGPIDVLLLGSDSREGEGAEEMGQRSDTMMLVHIPADREKVYVVSILRDSWVDVPGEGMSKINAAFGIGGYPLAVQTVEQLMGVDVNHLVEVDFQGFRGVTNALGGVKVCNPTAFSSGQVNPSFYPRGEILLQDTAALRYVRERHAFANGDFTRVENQQRYVGGALNRFLSADVLANPGRTSDVVATLSEHLTVDDALTSGTVASLAWQLRSVRADDVEMLTVPSTGVGESAGGASIIELDEAKMADLRSALQADDVQRYVDAEQAERARRKAERAAEASAAASGVASPSPSATAAATTPGTPVPTASPAMGEDVCGG